MPKLYYILSQRHLLRIYFSPREVECSFGGINGLKLIVFANVLSEMSCSAKVM